MFLHVPSLSYLMKAGRKKRFACNVESMRQRRFLQSKGVAFNHVSSLLRLFYVLAACVWGVFPLDLWMHDIMHVAFEFFERNFLLIVILREKYQRNR